MAAIIFTITSEGLTASLDAANTGLGLQLTHVSGHDAAGIEIGRWPLSGGIVEPNSNTLRFSSVMTSTSRKELYGLKLLADSLVFATSVAASPLVVVDANIDFAPAFGLALESIPVGSITVTTDPNAALAIILMLQHVGAAHPHPQYAMQAVFDNHVVQNGLEHANLANLISAEAQVRDTADQNLNQDIEQQQTNLLAHIDQNALEHANLLAMISALNQQISQLNAKPSVFGWAAVAIQASRVTNTILQAVITISQQSGGFSVPALDANGDNGTLEHFLFANLEADDITAKYTFLLTLPANLPANHFVFAPGWTVVDPQTLKIEYEQGTIYQPSSDDYREDESPINTSHLIQIMA